MPSGKILKVIRTDNEFLTKQAQNWAATNGVSFQPSTPDEHNTVRRVERVHRTLQEMVVKALAHKQHLSPQFLGYAYLHFADMLNILPARDSGNSPYALWYGKPFDASTQPILPFGSIVMSHIPLDQQTSLSGRAVECVYVGRAPLHSDAIKLFNPNTKRCIIRQSFKYISTEEQISPTYVFSPDVPLST